MSLFKTLKVGKTELKNRFVMAPLTRCRATMPGNIPNALMAEYYSQRATAGLIITEATMIDQFSAFNSEGGVYTPEQIEGWKLTTKAVHENGGKIFCQIYQPGYASHSSNPSTEGKIAYAPSAVAPEHHKIGAEFNATGDKVAYETPRALEVSEIPELVDKFAQAAKNAIEAGFDGVEIHGANGYILDEFLRESMNKRTDNYGGAPENRARLLLEVVKAVSEAIGKEKVGVRLSPLNQYQQMKDSDPAGLIAYVAGKLNEAGIAYVHLMRADFFGPVTIDVVTPARKNFSGPLIVNMGLEAEEAEEAVAKGTYDLACFGTKFLANPDFPARVQAKAKLNEMDPTTFYTKDAKGYTDYPFMQ